MLPGIDVDKWDYLLRAIKYLLSRIKSFLYEIVATKEWVMCNVSESGCFKYIDHDEINS
jgi:hypothetical protein